MVISSALLTVLTMTLITMQHTLKLSPRLSLGAVTGTKLEAGPIKDILIAGTWEANSSDYPGADFNNYLYGIGFDLAIPYYTICST